VRNNENHKNDRLVGDSKRKGLRDVRLLDDVNKSDVDADVEWDEERGRNNNNKVIVILLKLDHESIDFPILSVPRFVCLPGSSFDMLLLELIISKPLGKFLKALS
jgi:hypothetical protein